jgi:RNA polymerase sigma factor (sigma-70 family)
MSETYNSLALEFKNTKTHKSFAKLYHKIRPGLKNYTKNIVKDGDVTEDILAKTFEKIYRKIDTFNPEYSITTWSYSIAKRECIRWIKRERNKTISLSYFNDNGGEAIEGDDNNSLSFTSDLTQYENISESESWDTDNETFEKYDLAVKAINNLKPMYREILIDNLVNGMKYKDIAFKLEPKLYEMHLKFEEGQLSRDECKEYDIFYKTILQRVKNRIRRGKMIIEEEINNKMAV